MFDYAVLANQKLWTMRCLYDHQRLPITPLHAHRKVNIKRPSFINLDRATGELLHTLVQNVGNLLIDASQEADPTYELKKSIHTPRNHSTRPNEPKADSSEGTIQKSITSGKQNWCLVGEHQNRRGCIAIAESDKCLSGQVFPNEHMCLNPTMTP